jgi:endonuclease-3
VSGGAPVRRGAETRKAITPRGSQPRTAAESNESRAIEFVCDRLHERYGTPRPKGRRAPLDELVFTILSQNTTDTNRDRAWASLWQHFDTWEEVATARVDKIAKAIKIGGLHKVKARRIKDILWKIKKERGDFDLDYLEAVDMAAARAELQKYKGVGAKSINCILLFSLDLPAFPVDTHVHRLLRRLGIVETGDLSKANRDIQEHVRDEIAYPLHMNMIRYGREVCHAQRPKCWDCCIEDLCVYENKKLTKC